jgi:DNA invertase Pin-like site-specific DNA recombinase
MVPRCRMRGSMIDNNSGKALPVVEYVRMSTDRQEYSIAVQSAANHAYAASHGMKIIRTYADQGKSGLTLERRASLQSLIAEVETGRAGFFAILVYDVSRWGRFQDADQSAHLEYRCKRAGIKVHYCAEQFENDGTAFSAIVKNIKRAMAGEYSRELSVKCFAGARRLIEQGFRMGGYAGYGLRRQLIDQKGTVKGVLEVGEWKNLTTDRVILVPGPENELETVRWIFRAYVHRRKTEEKIAQSLNKRRIKNGFGRPWTRTSIKSILRNEKYIGNNVWNCTTAKLRSLQVPNKPEEWLRYESAFEGIVDRSTFDAAQAIRLARYPIAGTARRYSDDEMLDHLRRLLSRHGYLSKRLIDQNRTKSDPSGGSYERRFGGMKGAYERLEYDVGTLASEATKRRSNEEFIDILRKLLRKHGTLTESIIRDAKGSPSPIAYRKRFRSLFEAYILAGYSAKSWNSFQRARLLDRKRLERIA